MADETLEIIKQEYVLEIGAPGPQGIAGDAGAVLDLAGKADKVTSATAGHVATLDASGNLTDSGLAPSEANVPNTVVKRDLLGASSFAYVNVSTQFKVGAVVVFENPAGVLNVGGVLAADGSQLTNIPSTAVTGLGSAATKNADNTANNTVLLDGAGKLPTAVLPTLAVTKTDVVASQAAMLALVSEMGDVAIRTDTGKTYILSSNSPGTLADWKEIVASGAVTSINGYTGTVVLTTSDVAEGSRLYYTTARVQADAPNVTLGTANGLSLAGQTLSLAVFGASGASHSSGAVPDPGGVAGTTKFLREDGTWVVPTAGGGTPGGTDTQVQFNDGGAFGGTSDLVFNKTTKALTVSGKATVGGLTVSAPSSPHLYWRIYITAHGSAGYSALSEIEMRATTGGADQCNGGTANASSSTIDAPKAFNNTNSDYWASLTGTPQWISYQFPSAVTVAQVMLRNSDLLGPTTCPTAFAIQYSDDGLTWYTATSYTGVTWSSSGQTQLFTSSSPTTLDFGGHNIGNANNVSATYLSGDGSLITNLNASNLLSGTVPIAALGTSGTKSGTTFLTGANTFAAIQSSTISDATSLNTGSTVVKRSATGSFDGTVITTAQVKATVTTTSYTTDASTGCNFLLDLQSNFTLANPTNGVDKQVVIWRFRQDATGGRTITLGGSFLVPGNVTLQLSKSANAVDVLIAQYDSTAAKWHVLEFVNENTLRCVEPLTATFSGGGAVLSASGEKARIFVDYDCDIVEWELLADQSGSLTLDVKKCTRGTYPGSLATIITTGAPTLSSQAVNFATSPNWATGLSAGDVLEVSINGTPVAVTWAKLTLKARRR